MNQNNDSANLQYQLVDLDKNSGEYFQIKTRVEEARNRTLVVYRIQRIVNATIKERYLRKKEEQLIRYPNLREEMLFHGTGRQNLQNICQNNFHPRFCSDPEYGKGVYFSESSSFAAIYPGHDLKPQPFVPRYMFLCTVMIGNEFEILDRWGERYKYEFHPEGYDTTIRRLDFFRLGLVCKCGEDEYLPEFLITYQVVGTNYTQ